MYVSASGFCSTVETNVGQVYRLMHDINTQCYQRTYATGNLNQNCNTIQILILVDIRMSTKNLCIKNLQIVPESLF